MKQPSHGHGSRYDNDGGGNHIDRIRERAPGLGMFLNFRKRFCWECKQYRPKDKAPAVKGWRCKECKGKNLGDRHKPHLES